MSLLNFETESKSRCKSITEKFKINAVISANGFSNGVFKYCSSGIENPGISYIYSSNLRY